jgi:transcriptional regulator with XRE-family HTH domain
MMSEEEAIGIGQRLREVRGEMSQTEFGEILGVHQNTVVSYEAGKRMPGTASISKLFYELHIDLTWLITGHRKSATSDGCENSGQQKSGVETIGQRLHEVRVHAALTQAEFANQLAVVSQTIRRYEADETVPDGIFLLKLKEIFNISPEWLLLGKNHSLELLKEFITDLEKRKR